MPWTPKQMKSIRARAHGWQGPGAFENVSQSKAKMMEGEGIKAPRKKAMDKIVKKRRRKYGV